MYTSRKRTVLVISLAAQFLWTPIATLAQSAGFSIAPVIKRGDPVSDGGRFFDCGDCIGRITGSHGFNNLGDVTISAEVVGGTCFSNRFLITRGQSVRLGDFCHTTEFGKLTFLGSVNVNGAGQAAFNAGTTVGNRIVEMLLLYSDGDMTRIVQEGDRTPTGTLFKGCGFGQPAINNNGEVAFFACTETDNGLNGGDGVSVYSGGEIRKVVVSDDPTPIGGTFALNFIPPQAVQMNDRSDVLFQAGVILDLFVNEKLGLFLKTGNGIKPIEIDGDPMPSGGRVTPNTFGFGDLNSRGDVVFAVGLTGGQTDSGIFLYSADRISKIMLQGEPTPLGGTFFTLSDNSFTLPRVNANGTVAFKIPIIGGSSSSAIFLASPRAMVKAVAAGDQLPTGETIRFIDTFAMNDLGQVAFFAYGKKNKTMPLGVFVATPVPPTITSIKLKNKKGTLQLRVNGSVMITNDTVIEINGVVLSDLDYPADFRQDGGFTTRVVSRDARLEQLITEGESVQVTIYNSLTNLRSAPKVFSR